MKNKFGTTCFAAVTLLLLSAVTHAGLMTGDLFNRTLNGLNQGSMAYGTTAFFSGNPNGQAVFTTVGGNGSNFFIVFADNGGNGLGSRLNILGNGGGYGATGLATYFPGGIQAVTLTSVASGVKIPTQSVIYTTNAVAPVNGLTLAPLNIDSWRAIVSPTAAIANGSIVAYEVSVSGGITAVPEPSTFAVALGLIGFAGLRWKRSRKGLN